MTHQQFEKLLRTIKEKRALLLDMYQDLGYDMRAYLSGERKLSWLGEFEIEDVERDRRLGAVEEAGFYQLFDGKTNKYYCFCDESM